MLRSQLLDLYFIEARSKLIDVAAFLDRIERAEGGNDYRIDAFKKALHALATQPPPSQHAELVLLAFSDPTLDPIHKAGAKAATGAPRTEDEPSSLPQKVSQV